jgi:probable phosphoglycerate mutase
MTDGDIEFVYPGARDGYSHLDWWFHAPGGETYEVFSSRLGEWLTEAARSAEPLVAVSHGGASRVMRGLYLGLPMMEALALPMPQDAVFRLANGEVERIDCLPLALTPS